MYKEKVNRKKSKIEQAKLKSMQQKMAYKQFILMDKIEELDSGDEIQQQNQTQINKSNLEIVKRTMNIIETK